jgi:hypothetical protein
MHMIVAGPELAIQGSTLAPVSRAIDIWSFGCVLSLAATWVVLGVDGINQFRILREQAQSTEAAEEGPIVASGAFHDGQKLLDAINDWHQFIRAMARRSDVITTQILDLVDTAMLKSEPEERASATHICGDMRHILTSNQFTPASQTAQSVLDALLRYDSELGSAIYGQGRERFGTLKLNPPDLAGKPLFDEPAIKSLHEVAQDQYRYQRLADDRSIRILKLLPAARRDQEIVCEMEVQSFDHGDFLIDYEGLSWTWGGTPWTEKIKIQQNGQKFFFNVPPTLVSALKALRLRREARRLWVDCVSIDQESFEEKNLQVALMPSIFGTARNVCVWLGDADGDSNLAIDFIKQEVLKLQGFDELCESPSATAKWRAMMNLMRREWFERRECHCAGL